MSVFILSSQYSDYYYLCRYGRALQWLEDAELKNQQEEDELNKLLSRGYNNLAVCYNIENMPRRACSACNRVPIPTAKTYFKYVVLKQV